MTTMTAEQNDVLTTPHAAKTTILHRAVCLVLHCGELGNNRKVDLEQLAKVAGGTAESLDEDQFHATMRLINPKTLLPPKRVQAKAKAYLRSIGISAHRVFGESTTLIPLAKTEEAWERLKAFEAELVVAAKEVADGYAEAQAEQAEKLGPLYNAKLYRTPKEVERAFTLDYNFVSFDSPERLETVNTALAMASQQKFEAQLASAFDEVVATLRGEALHVARELVDRLTPGPDGKPKVLRGTALRDIEQFLSELPTRNLAGDDQLVAVMTRLRDRVAGVDVAAMRDMPSLKTTVQQAAAEAVAALEPLVEVTRKRGISFGGI